MSLILTRKQGEKIIIYNAQGDEIRVRTMEITENYVRLGIEAPEKYGIDRTDNLTKPRDLERKV